MPSKIEYNRIMKNTIILYFRMFFQMVVYLYTSRILITTLGVTDYGIYDVAASLVIGISFLNNAMTTSTQRFITYSLGRYGEHSKELQKTVSASLFIHLLIASLVVVIGGIVGKFFFEHYAVIPADRFQIALTVFYLSLFATAATIISVPYNAMIIAYEHMGAFSFISILDVCLKLLAVLLLQCGEADKLLFYAMLILIETILIRIVYWGYCRWQFKSARFSFSWDKSLFKDMLGFAGWSVFGNLAVVCYTQGLNLLLNVFGGAGLNAARGLAFQVQTATYAFVSNFQMAMNPQITKSYAQNDLQGMHQLICRSSKFSYYLMWLIVLPLSIVLPYVLDLWLDGKVPDYTAQFSRILLMVCLIEALANPLMIGASATGNVKKYYIIIGNTLLLIMPLAYIALKLGFTPSIVFVIQLVVLVIAQAIRVKLCSTMYALSPGYYLRTVVAKVLFVSLASILPPCVYGWYFSHSTFLNVLIICLLSLVSSVMAIWLFGINKVEKEFVKEKLFSLLKNKLR